MTQTVFKLSDAFIESYKTRKPNFGFNGLGELIYYRTYSRLKENNQNEQWWETCKRVVEGTYNMQKQHIEQYSLGWNASKAQRSAQEMYERIFSMKFLPPGRGLWAMGSPIINERGMYAALNNCGYVSTATLKEDLSKPFLFLMDMSMLGVGIGFDVRGAGQINIKSPNKSKVVETYMIPDSREGWVESVKLLLESYFLGTADVNFDYSLIRPAGVPIKGFGGIASGVEPLKELHKNIIKTLDKNIGEPITVTTIVDIMNFIGKCVVAGNVRRCLRKGTLVFTPNGAKPIENILVGDTVFTSDGTTKVTESVYQGKQELLRINTDAGFIDCTEKHRIAVLDTPQSYMWKHANEITVDDRLVFIRPIVQDKHMEIPAFENGGKKVPYGNNITIAKYDELFGDERLVPIKVLSIEHVGIDDTYDLSVLDKQEFVLGNGLLVHNTAEIVFGEPDSDEYLDLKNYKVNPDRVEHGWSSNNSIFAEIGMDYGPVCDRVAHNGEPGFAWLSNMQNYSRMNNGPDYKDVRASGGNPCIIGDTLIAVADGRNAVPIKDLVGTQYPVYTIKNGKVSISMAIKTWKTRDNAKVYKLTLNDGSFLIATNDHKIMLRNGNYKELDTLLVGESLMPFNSYVSNKNYRQISSNTGRDRRQYRMIAEFNNLIVNPKITAIHHRNFNSFDDRIENLESMLHESHRKLHSLKMIGLNNPMKNPDIAIKAVRNRNYSGMNNPTCSNTKRKLEKKGLWNHKVLSVEFYGYADVYDIEVENTHNFGIITVSHDNKYIRTSGIFIHNCLEQTLESYEMCCLVETFPMNHESLEDYRRTLKFAYLYAKTVTLGKTHWPETNRVLLRNRRIGCSVSGIAQFITKHGVEELRTWLEAGYIAIQNYDKIYSDWLAIPRSIKTTSVKPSGTVSLLAGATPGVHYPESRFYIRRVRLALTSQLVKPLEKAGYRVEPAFGDPSSVVVEIPIDTGEGIRTLKNVSMWEQLALAAFMQRHWADNQVSCTVTFTNEEAQQIKFALDYYQYQLKGISFLPRIKSGAYPQMPYEEITETEYNESKSKLKMLDFSIIFNETTEVEKFCNNDTCTI